MVTEIMGFLIIIGVLLVVVVRRQMQKSLEKPEQINASVAALQSELENAGDAIIKRIGTQVDRLEDLVAQADEKIAVLDAKLQACESVKINAVQAVTSEMTETAKKEEKVAFKGEFAETLAAAERASERQSIKECHVVGKKIPSSSSIQVACLLEDGYSIEEVSRKTGMGKGAIELICEMNRVQKNV
ncbi:MAG: hypothetical protein WCS30_06665 [Selenomonadaceae bacterium]